MLVDGELAEAVAEVLSRYLPDGVVIEATAVQVGVTFEGGQSVGPLRVCGYIPVDKNMEETRKKIEQGFWYLGRISPLPEPQYKKIQEVNWMEAWKDHYHPIPIGKRLLILPAWIEHVNEERIPIRLELGMAFGTGMHPTTQLCLKLAEEFISQLSSPDGLQLIDIGCGSGILSIASLLLGAERALGVDIDAEALRASRENAALNHVSDKLELGRGSVTEILTGRYCLQKAQLVFANILAGVLVKLLDQGIGELVQSDGCMILSGILVEQAAEVESALNSHGFTRIDKRVMDDWVALSAKR
jgi:ribosomal protein L11 methyltransferase